MFAKEYTCRVLENIWITPTVIRFRFEPLKKFTFDPGQFLSILVPPPEGTSQTVKRCYSFASSPEEAKYKGYYELCVKYVPGGLGSGYLASLRTGDTFQMMAPYGDFKFKDVRSGNALCFISTGTGIAPFRSILYSRRFHTQRPEKTLCILGVRGEEEALYQKDLETVGVEMVTAVSQPSSEWTGFTGRVTDYLKSLPTTWAWHTTDFYVCGGGEMVTEVSRFLEGGHGVPERNIHKEAFSLTLGPKIQKPKTATTPVSPPPTNVKKLPAEKPLIEPQVFPFGGNGFKEVA
jgi:ferredoxin-NADP reductase